MKKRFLLILFATWLLGSPQAGFGCAPQFLRAAFTVLVVVSHSRPTTINGDIGTNAGGFNGSPFDGINGHVAGPYLTPTAHRYFSSNVPCVTTLAGYGGPSPVVPGSYCVGAATTLALLQNEVIVSNGCWQVDRQVTPGQNPTRRETLPADGAINPVLGAASRAECS